MTKQQLETKLLKEFEEVDHDIQSYGDLITLAKIAAKIAEDHGNDRYAEAWDEANEHHSDD